MGNGLTIVIPHWQQPKMLAAQVAVWNSYEGLRVKIILVDDCSETPPTVDCKVPIQILRITERIPWNAAGARNLGCSQADGWILVTDLDTVIYREDLEKIMASIVDKKSFYVLEQVSLPEHRAMKPQINALAFHRELFDSVGGYDEDYSGAYGREVVDFYERLCKIATRVNLQIKARFTPHWLISDARTKGLPRDPSRNFKIYSAKRAGGLQI